MRRAATQSVKCLEMDTSTADLRPSNSNLLVLPHRDAINLRSLKRCTVSNTLCSSLRKILANHERSIINSKHRHLRLFIDVNPYGQHNTSGVQSLLSLSIAAASADRIPTTGPVSTDNGRSDVARFMGLDLINVLCDRCGVCQCWYRIQVDRQPVQASSHVLDWPIKEANE